MIVQISIMIVVSLLSAIVGAFIALKIQQRAFHSPYTQQQAWERAQEGHFHAWQEKQEQRLHEMEVRLSRQIQQIEQEWQAWKAQDQERLAQQARQLEETKQTLYLERELARLPRIEETSLTLTTEGRPDIADWQPAQLQAANLSGYDLSHRYLGHANLQNARLANSNFFMSDLSYANLMGADLSGADLSGANLSHANLKGAILTRTNLLVADLNNANLTGANLLGARNLTVEQIYTTIYDNTTRFDAGIDITMPRMASLSLPAITKKPQTARVEVRSPQPALQAVEPAISPAFSAIPETPQPEQIAEATPPDWLAQMEHILAKKQSRPQPYPSLPAQESLLDTHVADKLLHGSEPANHNAASSSDENRAAVH